MSNNEHRTTKKKKRKSTDNDDDDCQSVFATPVAAEFSDNHLHSWPDGLEAASQQIPSYSHLDFSEDPPNSVDNFVASELADLPSGQLLTTVAQSVDSTAELASTPDYDDLPDVWDYTVMDATAVPSDRKTPIQSVLLSADSLQLPPSADKPLIPSPDIPVADFVDVDDTISIRKGVGKVSARPSPTRRSSMTLRSSTFAKGRKVSPAIVRSNAKTVRKTRSYVREIAQRISEVVGGCANASEFSPVSMAVDTADSRPVSKSKETKLPEIVAQKAHASGQPTPRISTTESALIYTNAARRRGRSDEGPRSRSSSGQAAVAGEHRSRSPCKRKVMASSSPQWAVEAATTKTFGGDQAPPNHAAAGATAPVQQDMMAHETLATSIGRQHMSSGPRFPMADVVDRDSRHPNEDQEGGNGIASGSTKATAGPEPTECNSFSANQVYAASGTATQMQRIRPDREEFSQELAQIALEHQLAAMLDSSSSSEWCSDLSTCSTPPVAVDVENVFDASPASSSQSILTRNVELISTFPVSSRVEATSSGQPGSAATVALGAHRSTESANATKDVPVPGEPTREVDLFPSTSTVSTEKVVATSAAEPSTGRNVDKPTAAPRRSKVCHQSFADVTARTQSSESVPPPLQHEVREVTDRSLRQLLDNAPADSDIGQHRQHKRGLNRPADNAARSEGATAVAMLMSY